jgi:hypothetical protein
LENVSRDSSNKPMRRRWDMGKRNPFLAGPTRARYSFSIGPLCPGSRPIHPNARKADGKKSPNLVLLGVLYGVMEGLVEIAAQMMWEKVDTGQKGGENPLGKRILNALLETMYGQVWIGGKYTPYVSMRWVREEPFPLDPGSLVPAAD